MRKFAQQYLLHSRIQFQIQLHCTSVKHASHIDIKSILLSLLLKLGLHGQLKKTYAESNTEAASDQHLKKASYLAVFGFTTF